ncbi:Geranylgeranyl pyrophosphate synthase-like protein [Pleurostoma richardsiae]|uniref:Geranylgeranyl pyrophosphate synthase-like protein n=1 Tax=Pleurostoma richardsiae TaxID=41990 RepID=A0AA38SBC6_9PEZI|nr:Geranylgeranyl pyrophosphate synthase-like protein [Pleurostoma richardsiae]
MFLSKRSQKEPAAAAAASAAATMPSASSAASSSFLQSPNAIPPRTSSTGQNTPHQPSKPVLRPVPESDWIAQGSHHRSRKASVASTSFPVNMQPPIPPDPSRYAHEDLDFTAKKTWSEEKDKVIMGPFDYLDHQPGKDFRPQLINAFNAWLEVPPESLEVITKVVGMLHTASLLVDDVEDSSLLRRGLPVAHSIFGVPQTINSANYVYFCALQELQKLRNSKAITVFAEELLNLHRGQGMDLFWRDTLTCPTEDDYLEMVGNKTGGLFRLGIKLMQAESRSLVDCVPLVNIVGLIFQIRDDYMNLFSREYSANKGMCEDLTEGKFSFPVIHAIRSDPTNLQLLNILKQKPTDEEVKRYAVNYMEGTGSVEYTRQVVHVLIERARAMADDIDDGTGKGRGIHKILDKMVIDA